MHLFDIDIPGKITFQESQTLSPGNEITTFDTEYGKFGLGICYDIRFAELAMCMTRKGCGFLFYPGAFNMTTGPAHWELLARGRAVDNQVYVAVISPARVDVVANPDSYHAWGHTSVVNPWGEVISTCDEKETIVYAAIDMDKIGEFRDSVPITKQRREDIYCLKEM